MLGKNNLNEKKRKMNMQNKKERFSIRKFTVGAASVLLGFTFFGMNTQFVKADNISSEQEEKKENIDTNQSDTTLNKTDQNVKPDLSTYSGLTSFLKASTVPQTGSTKLQTSSSDSTSSETNKDNHVNNDQNSQTQNTNGTNTSDQTDKLNQNGSNSDQTDKTNSNGSNSDQTDKNNSKGSNSDQSSDITGSGDNSKDNGKLPDNSKDNNDPANTGDQSGKTPDSIKKKDTDLTANDNKTGYLPTIVNGAAHVYNWAQFRNAYQNKTINEIDIMQNIVADNNINWVGFDFDGRTLLIKSYDADKRTDKYTINFKGNHPNLNGYTSLDLTYENLNIWSADFYGIARAYDLIGNNYANITFKNVDFHGSQMIYTNNNTHIFFVGNNTAETVKTPYDVNGPSDGNNQQLFQYTGNNNSITFSGTFVGKTYGGNVIEMSGDYNKVTIDKGATVSLYPRGNSDGTSWISNPAETTGTIFAIVLRGNNESVDVNGTLNIVVQNDKYKGQYDNNQATAIYINDSTTSTFNILNDATVNINTNGDIADFNYRRNVIYDGGNFNIRPRGTLNVTGQNMGNYSDTLVYIKGKADIENGAFNIRLLDNAGTGAITLVDVQGGTLIVNNPTSLILDAHLNKNPNTSIIGSMPITITNVRQKFDLSGLGININELQLPPFHVLKVRKTNQTISVDNIELLNGLRKITQKDLTDLKDKMANSGIKFEALPPDVITSLQTAASTNATYDSLFKDIIQKAFNNQNNFGYNNISFIPANPSGFLDIDPSKVDVVRNNDGSQTISGKAGSVINYDAALDGPDTDLQHPKNIFSLVLPVATKAYITANLVDGNKNKSVWSPKDANGNELIANPYADTNDSLRDTGNSSLDPLPTQFVAVVNDDGSFEFTIPAEQVLKLNKAYSVELSPSANFIGYDQTEINSGSRPISKNLNIQTLNEARNHAAQEINDAINNAKTNLPNNLTPEQNAAFNDAIAKAAAAASQTITDDNKTTSVYDPSANTYVEVNNRKQAAIDIIEQALKNAKSSSETETNRADAINELNDAANKQISSYPSQTATIMQARDNAINQVKAAKTPEEITKAKDTGVDAINHVAQGYKDAIKADLDSQIKQVKSALQGIAEDTNLDSKQKDDILALADRLNRPQAIIADKGDIDKDEDQPSVESHQKEAQDAITALQNTINAITKLESSAKDQITKHTDKAEQIKDALNKTVHDVITGDDPDGSKGLEVIDKVYADQEAENIINAAQAAKKRVQETGLSADDQASYLTEIDNAVKLATAQPGTDGYDANESIYGTSDENAIKQRIAKAQNAFAKAAAKAELVGFGQTSNTNIGVTTTPAIDQAIKAGLTAIDQATDIDAAEEQAKKNVLKEISKKKLNDAESDFENQLDNVTGLTAKDIDDVKEQARKLINNEQKPVGYNQKIDQADSLEAIDSVRNDGIDALSKLLAAQTEKGQLNKQITEATQKIRQKQEQANQAIDNINSLTDEQKAAYHKQVNDLADQGVNDLATTESSKIDDLVNTVNGNIDNVVTKAQGKANEVVETAKTSAKQKLADEATAAKNAIDQIPDSQLSQTSKDYYKDLIDKHVKEATDKIDATTVVDAIASIQKDGEANINRDLNDAQISAARSKAIKDLRDAKEAAKKVLNDAHDAKSISDSSWQDKLNQIDKYYDQATEAIAVDYQLGDITNHATKGIADIKSVADSISSDIESQKLAQQKQNALNDLQKAVDNVRNHITNDPNLSPTEKTKYYNQITEKFNNAQSAIQAAGKDQVQVALNDGKVELNKIQEDADIQSAKDKAISELLAEKNTIYQKIGNLDEVTSANKDQLRKKVDAAYDAAISKVNNPSPATIDQITSEKEQGKKNIDDVITDLNINKIINQQKLDQYAEQAINRIQSSTDISQDLKSQTITAIQSARDSAKAKVTNQTDIASANSAEKDGEKAIDLAESQGNGLDTLKNNASKQIDDAADSAIKRLNDLYNSLSDEAKTELKSTFDDVTNSINTTAQNAKAQIKKATNKQNVSDIYNDAINSIGNAESKANLSATKSQAKEAIQKAADEAKKNLSDPKDQDAIDVVAKLGVSDVDAAQDIDTVNKIKGNAIDGIKNITSIAQSSDAENTRRLKQEAIDALNQKLGDKTQNTGALGDVGNLIDLTDQQKADYQNALQQAHDRAVANVEGATKENIDTEKNTGLKNIDDIVTAAKLQAAKNRAKADLDHLAQDAVNKDKKDETTINAERDKAKANVDKAQNQDEVKTAKDNGTTTITNIVNTADNEQLTANKAAAKSSFEEAVNKLQTQLNNDLANKKIGQDQFDDLKSKLDKVRSDGETRITSSTKQTDLDDAIAKNTSDLNGISSAITSAENLNEALAKLQDAVNKATASANKIANDDPELAGRMREQIEQERSKAAKNIQAAKNSSQDANVAINEAAANGVNALNHLTERFEQKNKVINDLKQYSQSAKTSLQDPNLSSTEVATGEQAINHALQQGITNIYQATDTDDLAKIEDTIKQNIDNAKLPTSLLAEKNKQISALDQYVKDKGDINSIAKDLSDEQKQDLQNQVDQAVKKAKEKIQAINLPENAQAADLETAKNKLSNAEKGIPENGETADFGESGVDKVYTLAKTKEAIFQAKQEAIAELQQNKNAANEAVEDSGLSVSDQAKQKQKIQDIFDSSKDKINNISDKKPDGTDKTVEEVTQEAKAIVDAASKGYQGPNGEKIPGFDQVKNDADLAGAKTTAEGILQNKQTQAKQTIDQSQLTQEQKTAAKNAVDTAYENAKTEIEKQTDISKIPTDEAQIGQEIDNIVKNSSSWVKTDQTNALNGTEVIDGLQEQFDKLTAEQKANPEYSGNIKDITDSITAIKQADNIQAISAAYDKGITALNKLKGMETINESLNKAKADINANNDLDQDKKNELIQNAENHAKEGKQNIANVTAPTGDPEAKKNQISQAADNAVNDIQSEVNKATDVSRTKADDELKQKYQEAIDKLHKEYGAQAITSATDSAWNTHQNVTGDTPEEIQKNELDAEKAIAKGAVDDAAANAKNKLDKDETKKPDGSKYTDKEKQDIKDQIDKNSKDAKDQIDNSDDSSSIDKHRDDGITIIGGSNVEIDKAAAQTKFDQDTAKLQKQIDDDLAGKKLNQDQYNQLKNQISQVKQDGTKRISESTTAEELTKAQEQNQADLSKTSSAIARIESINQIKQNAINELQANKDAADQAIEKSGLSASDQAKQKQKIQDIFDSSKDKINNISDKKPDGTDKTVEEVTQEAKAIVDAASKGYQGPNGEKIPGFDQVKNDADLAGAKTTAEGILQNKQTQAKQTIDQSQLTQEQKTAAKNAVDTAYENAKTEIEKQTDISKIPTDEAQIGQEIDNIVKNSSSWVKTDQTNALNGTEVIDGLQEQFDKLTAEQKANPEYSGNIKDITDSITAIKQADNIQAISAAYDKGITALNKLKGMETINESLNKAKADINANNDLDQDKKNELIQNAENHAKEGKQNIANVTAPTGDPEAKKNQISQAADNAVNDIQSEVNKATDVSRTKADDELKQKYQEAIDKLHKEYGAQAITSATDSAWNTHQHVTGNTFDEIQKNELDAEKAIAKGAVDDAAANAKNKLDKDETKKPDGSKYTDKEKQDIKDQIDKNSKDAKDKINQTTGKKDDKTGKTDTDDARDEGTKQIKDTLDNGSSNNSNSGGSGSSSDGSGNSQVPVATKPGTGGDKDVDTSVANAEEVTLMHNAYVYDLDGKRCNKIILGAGSIVKTYGIENINGNQYYILIDRGDNNRKYYLAIGNVKYLVQKLKNDASVYDKYGNKIKNQGVIKKGETVHTYGDVVNIRGEKYFIIGTNQYIKASKVNIEKIVPKTENAEVTPVSVPESTKENATVEKTIMHNAYLYDEKGVRCNKLIFGAGSIIDTVGIKRINGKLYYGLADGMYIAAGNIDPKQLKLKHNAFIYGQYGNRISKRILRKHKKVRTYGAPVKIKNKLYYIVAKNKYVKKANF
ncbi:DUF1542 domain-containing protein [Lactobacillus panisapium]|uniref:SLAP domain-containing protein n=1 Tax=Lactobacillus panisapium TaxID=2012495 RepID=UPI001C69955C|nr:SLAP domain-containing protein [Lactobacillus panisapium]QYN58494.1 DUF1542 domain-containing protein [Lactobacillus panisapium]